MIEHFFQCPFCWERISMLIDLSVEHQSFIEDCEVCCRPMEVRVQTRNDEIISFDINTVN